MHVFSSVIISKFLPRHLRSPTRNSRITVIFEKTDTDSRFLQRHTSRFTWIWMFMCSFMNKIIKSIVSLPNSVQMVLRARPNPKLSPHRFCNLRVRIQSVSARQTSTKKPLTSKSFPKVILKLKYASFLFSNYFGVLAPTLVQSDPEFPDNCDL